MEEKTFGEGGLMQGKIQNKVMWAKPSQYKIRSRNIPT